MNEVELHGYARQTVAPVILESPRANRWMMLMIVILLGWLFFERSRPHFQVTNPSFEPRVAAPRGDLGADERATIDLFRNASPSVAFISNIGLRRDIFTRDIFKIPQGAGSGFVYDSAGYIVTNLHVIRGANVVLVTLADQSEHEADVVGIAPDKDLAVLKVTGVSPDLLRPLPLGTSSDLQVGQKVFAIGNPFGLDHTLTTGVVSALDRQIESLIEGRMIEGVIQTDAAINPGNSGGPLLDSAGRLIGVNTQIASPSGASAGIGFAVPVDIVSRVVPQIIRYGKVIRPGLGATIVPDAYRQRWGYEGVMLNVVPDGSSAAKAGLKGIVFARDGRRVTQPGDIIVQVGDRVIKDGNDLLSALERYEIGDKVEVSYRRGEEMRKTSVTLQPVD